MWARASGLARPETEALDPAAVVAAAAGIQAQDRRAARLSVWTRSRSLDAAAVDEALFRERSVVRTWAMRGTLHLVATEDVRWLLALLGPVFVAASRRRYAELGLDEQASASAVDAIAAAVAADGPLSSAALAERIRDRGVDVEPGSQAVAHLVRRAALEGVVCCGPEDGTRGTYVGLADWIGDRAGDGHARPPLGGDAALAELARRHLAAFGPARPEDFASWSGLTLARARAAWRLLEGRLTEVVAAGRPAWVLAGIDVGVGHGGPPSVRLLPAFDTYLLGHRGRELIVEDRFARRVWPGGGWIHPTVVVDGKAAGTWKLGSGGGSAAVVVEPFEALATDAAAALDADIHRVGAFLGTS
ncbi:MAG TPA: winged helix DNA-binding domain-containing protein [Acidimicrobiales bacterium]|nr:winged helix DNA-binding domain-containing protein [Acidimicrobiales bacterium]